MGCDILKVIKFTSLPDQVQDDLMRAEILPTMWPRYRISGYERVFHYRLMTVMRGAMHLVQLTTCMLVISAYECASDILSEAGSFVAGLLPSTLISWTCSCARTWALVAFFPSSLAG